MSKFKPLLNDKIVKPYKLNGSADIIRAVTNCDLMPLPAL